MDLNALATQLITALREATNANIAFEGTKRRNTFEDINNRGAARGTLYSTGGAAQQSRYNGTVYLPKVTQAKQGQTMAEISTKANLVDVQRQIDAKNRAAAELNKITFDALLD